MYLKPKMLKTLSLVSAIAAGSLSNSALATDRLDQRFQTNMYTGVTEVGQQIYDIHMLVFWICVAIGIGVFSFMFWSLFRYRKSRGHEPATFHHNTVAELLWTIIPAIILFVMAVPASKTMIHIYDTSEPDLDVLVTGYQWKWKYEYLTEDGEKVAFFSNLSTPREQINNEEPKGREYLLEVDEPLVIPVNKKTRFLVTANDVIHAWWVPELAVKKDAIPGFINESWAKPLKTGTYRGNCAELCGRDHGFMPIVVKVVEQEEFDQWLAGKQAEAAKIKELMAKEFTLEELMAQGKDVYNKSCVACHGANGEGGVGKAIAGSPVATGELHHHLEVAIKGVPGTAMQAFGGILNDVDMAAVITYQRNAFGNNMGDKVQPIDVYNFKQGK